MKWPRLQLKQHRMANHGGEKASSFNSPIPVNRRNESATPVCVVCTESWSDGGPMRNGLNASTVTSGLILSAQMVHQIMSVTLRVISNNRTIS